MRKNLNQKELIMVADTTRHYSVLATNSMTIWTNTTLNHLIALEALLLTTVQQRGNYSCLSAHYWAAF